MLVRDAVLGERSAAKSIAQRANQKHELEIDPAATIDICRVTFIADAPTYRNAAARDAMVAVSPRSCTKLMSKKWNIARRA
jgi:hypothetical protein